MSSCGGSIPTLIEIKDSTDESDSESTSMMKSTFPSQSSATSKEIRADTAQLASRRKCAHHMINAKEDISFQSFDYKKEEEISDGESDEDSPLDLDDEETMQCLKKIAYCRVFTNYLLRQYDMLAIEFQMPSNLEQLMLELKKRVDAYKAIRRSRMQLLQNKEDS